MAVEAERRKALSIRVAPSSLFPVSLSLSLVRSSVHVKARGDAESVLRTRAKGPARDDIANSKTIRDAIPSLDLDRDRAHGGVLIALSLYRRVGRHASSNGVAAKEMSCGVNSAVKPVGGARDANAANSVLDSDAKIEENSTAKSVGA